MISQLLFDWFEHTIFAYPITQAHWNEFCSWLPAILEHGGRYGDLEWGGRFTLSGVSKPVLGIVVDGVTLRCFGVQRTDVQVSVDAVHKTLVTADGNERIFYTADVWAAVQVIAHRRSVELVQLTHQIRDDLLSVAAVENRQLLEGLIGFGSVEQELPSGMSDLLRTVAPQEAYESVGQNLDIKVAD